MGWAIVWRKMRDTKAEEMLYCLAVVAMRNGRRTLLSLDQRVDWRTIVEIAMCWWRRLAPGGKIADRL
jgi:hypothetical protein